MDAVWSKGQAAQCRDAVGVPGEEAPVFQATSGPALAADLSYFTRASPGHGGTGVLASCSSRVQTASSSKLSRRPSTTF
jgi:hypothetical protein